MFNGSRNFHPIVLFLYYVTAVITIMLNRHPFFLFFSVILLILLNWAIDRCETFKRWWKLLLFFSLLFLIVTPLFNRRGQHILFFLFNNPITLEAFIHGINNFLTLFAIILLFITFPLVIRSDQFLYLFSRVLPKWGLLAMLSVRFVPLLEKRLKEIHSVQKSRGLSIYSGSLKERIQNGTQLVQILLTWSLEDGIQTADSMAARGYGLKKRTHYHRYRFEMSDLCIVISMISLCCTNIFGAWLGDTILTITPILEPIWLYGREWFFLFIQCMIIGFPLILEGKEAILWHYWKQRI